MLWVALTVFVVAPLAAGVFAGLRALALWRDVKGSLRVLGEAADDIGARLETIESHESRDLDALDSSLERLRRSRAELRVLAQALARVREQASGAMALYPRK